MIEYSSAQHQPAWWNGKQWNLTAEVKQSGSWVLTTYYSQFKASDMLFSFKYPLLACLRQAGFPFSYVNSSFLQMDLQGFRFTTCPCRRWHGSVGKSTVCTPGGLRLVPRTHPDTYNNNKLKLLNIETNDAIMKHYTKNEYIWYGPGG